MCENRAFHCRQNSTSAGEMFKMSTYVHMYAHTNINIVFLYKYDYIDLYVRTYTYHTQASCTASRAVLQM